METQQKRLYSLDALRGFDLLWIIGGERVVHGLAKASDCSFISAVSNQLEHVHWEGYHFYDQIMPLFLFMVGMSIPFSIGKRMASGDSLSRIYRHSVKRSLILFVLGMVCQCNLLAFDSEHLFIIHDTLQAIAIGYLFSVFIYTRCSIRQQLATTVALLVAYFCILQFIPAPGHPAGEMLRESNIAKYVEGLVFGRFDDAPSQYTWFLGSMGFIATVMSGVLASTLVRSESLPKKFLAGLQPMVRKTIMLAAIGGSLVAVACVMNVWFPIIKALWNPSFTILSSGVSLMLFALFYYVIDVLGWQRWAFALRVIGLNSIAVYMAVSIVGFEDIANNLLYGTEQLFVDYYPAIKSLGALAIIYILMYWMYRTKTFIKI